MASPSTKRTFATQEQFSHLVDFMYDKPRFSCSSSARYSYGIIERERLWNKLTEELNSIRGSVKTVKQWKVVWTDLKGRCRTNIRGNNCQETTNGDGILHEEPIKKMEERVIAIIHRDHINLLQSKQSPKSDCDYVEEELCIEPPSRSSITYDEIQPRKIILPSKEQLSHLVDFLYDKPKFSCGNKVGYSYRKDEREKLWSELAEQLNSLNGAVKTAKQWKVIWKDLKRRVRVNEQEIKKNQKAANGDSSLQRHGTLSDIDMRVIAIYQRDYNLLQNKTMEGEFCSEMPSTSKNARKKRNLASLEQWIHLANFMYDNPKFSCSSQAQYSCERTERDRLWSQLAQNLNSLKGGVKTIKQWKGVWKSLKRRSKQNLRAKKSQKTTNGYSPSHQNPIADVENLVIAVIHRDYTNSADMRRTKPTHKMDKMASIYEKRRRIEQNRLTEQKNVMEIATQHIDTLKIVKQLHETSAEVERKQADALRMLAECSVANIKMMENMSESIKLISETLKANTGALNNLTSAVNRIGNMPFFSAK